MWEGHSTTLEVCDIAGQTAESRPLIVSHAVDRLPALGMGAVNEGARVGHEVAETAPAARDTTAELSDLDHDWSDVGE